MASLDPVTGQIAVLNPTSGNYTISTIPHAAAANAATPKTAPSLTGAPLTVVGWIVLLVALYGLNHTKIGHELMFYVMVLIVLYLFSANYKNIQALIFKKGA